MKKQEKTRKAIYPERDASGNWYLVEVDVPESAKRRMIGRPLHELVVCEGASKVIWEMMHDQSSK